MSIFEKFIKKYSATPTCNSPKKGIKIPSLALVACRAGEPAFINPDGINFPFKGVDRPFLSENEMNSPLIGNAAQHPVQTLTSLESCPARLRDESTQTLVKVCKILAREGLRARVLELCESLDAGRKAIVRRAILPTHVSN